MATPQQLLQQYFGFDEFKPGQLDVIRHLLDGHSAAAVFPTGGGKSLCYQLPALAFDGLTLVVSPLIALMKDQIDALHARGIKAARLDSSLSADEYRTVMQDIRNGSLKLLYVSPERFNNERFREQVKQLPVSLFAVDEAHCISEWGHNFRPDYLKLAGFAKLFKAERILALTATATPAVLEDMRRVFQISEQHSICTGFYRSNLQMLMTPVAYRERDELLIQRFRDRPPGAAVVYVSLQKTAVHVAEKLRSAGFDAKHYHAGLKPEERDAVQEWFLSSEAGIVVATIAFGMGVDKSDIRSVYHYNLPKSLENYSQEIGRAGRDDRPSTCEVLACSDDLTVLENFILGDTPSRDSIQSLLEDLFGREDDFSVSLSDLSRQHDIRQLVLRTLLTYLELEGYLESGTAIFSEYQFKPLMPSSEIIAKFDGERADFLKRLLSRSVKKRVWFHIDIEAAVQALGETRERIVVALDYLGEQKMLDLRVTGVRNRYHCLHHPDCLDDVVSKLFAQVTRREKRELNRLDQMLQLVERDGCQVAEVCCYFGQPIEGDCGHCSWCESKSACSLAPRHSTALNEAEQSIIAAAVRELHQVLSDPHQITRLLCGLSSPAIAQARRQRDTRFGKLADIPYQVVMKAVEACLT